MKIKLLEDNKHNKNILFYRFLSDFLKLFIMATTKSDTCVVNINNFDINNVVMCPIDSKSFKAQGISYGKINYKYKRGTGPLYISIGGLVLQRNLIDPYKSKADGGFHESKYCSQRYKGVISLKGSDEESKKLMEIVNKKLMDLDTHVDQYGRNPDNNSEIEDENKCIYSELVKQPSKRAIDFFIEKNKEWEGKEKRGLVKNIIGNKLKLNLKVDGKTNAAGKFVKQSGEDATILCDIRKSKDVELNIDKINLDFMEKTFVRGAKIKIIINLSTWWCGSTQNKFGIKASLNTIIIDSLPSPSGFSGNFVDDDDDDFFAGTSKIEVNSKHTEDEQETIEAINNVIDNTIEKPNEKKKKEEEASIDDNVIEDEGASIEEEEEKPKKTIKKKTSVNRKPRKIIEDVEDDD